MSAQEQRETTSIFYLFCRVEFNWAINTGKTIQPFELCQSSGESLGFDLQDTFDQGEYFLGQLVQIGFLRFVA